MQQETVRHYDAQYGQFASRLYSDVRTEAFGEDIGQNGWLTADEHDRFIDWLRLKPGMRLLDVACGSGGTTLRTARRTGSIVHGIDIHAKGIDAARAAAEREESDVNATFEIANAAERLPFPDATFDGLICIDAVNHLPNRSAVFAEWARVLRPGGRLVFTDPIVVTGWLTNEEIAIRSSIGFFLFVPAGLDERMLADAGFSNVVATDRTENMARMASLWRKAREARERELRRAEGDETFDGQQRFLEVAARLASERRLSRIAFSATR